MDAIKKECSRCGIIKPVEEFHLNRCRPDGHSVYCKPCTRLYNRTYYAEKSHDRLVAWTYGLERGEYARMLEAQGGVCAICKQPETSKLGNTVKRLAVDHDHETGAPRGLLCHACNNIIGIAQDDVQRLHTAIEYLETPRPEWVKPPALGPSRVARCGTYSGYTSHLWHHETPCGACREAKRLYQRKTR